MLIHIGKAGIALHKVPSINLIATIPDTTKMPPIERSHAPLTTVRVTPKARINRIDVEFNISIRLNME